MTIQTIDLDKGFSIHIDYDEGAAIIKSPHPDVGNLMTLYKWAEDETTEEFVERTRKCAAPFVALYRGPKP